MSVNNSVNQAVTPKKSNVGTIVGTCAMATLGAGAGYAKFISSETGIARAVAKMAKAQISQGEDAFVSNTIEHCKKFAEVSVPPKHVLDYWTKKAKRTFSELSEKASKAPKCGGKIALYVAAGATIATGAFLLFKKGINNIFKQKK